ncbi:hypothetical protein EVAR_3552_1 [Eumeta japonica]|uniref:Uncharacterized protein n=1 Tax=Eumeta variegata TaxID=151549 RepID=A0A4C1SVG8_EUMVA|nr:hypothetical protein EVAR_3552_1 [Eumeta japonica]
MILRIDIVFKKSAKCESNSRGARSVLKIIASVIDSKVTLVLKVSENCANLLNHHLVELDTFQIEKRRSQLPSGHRRNRHLTKKIPKFFSLVRHVMTHVFETNKHINERPPRHKLHPTPDPSEAVVEYVYLCTDAQSNEKKYLSSRRKVPGSKLYCDEREDQTVLESHRLKNILSRRSRCSELMAIVIPPNLFQDVDLLTTCSITVKTVEGLCFELRMSLKKSAECESALRDKIGEKRVLKKHQPYANETGRLRVAYILNNGSDLCPPRWPIAGWVLVNDKFVSNVCHRRCDNNAGTGGLTSTPSKGGNSLT